jgi:hypothetical protein
MYEKGVLQPEPLVSVTAKDLSNGSKDANRK